MHSSIIPCSSDCSQDDVANSGPVRRSQGIIPTGGKAGHAYPEWEVERNRTIPEALYGCTLDYGNMQNNTKISHGDKREMSLTGVVFSMKRLCRSKVRINPN